MSIDAVIRRPPSLALRLTAYIALVIGAALLSLGWVIERAIGHHFAEQDAEELEVVARSVQHVLMHVPAHASATQITDQLAGAVMGHHGMFYFVQDPSGRVLYASSGPDLQALASAHANDAASAQVDPHRLIVWQEGDAAYRGAVLRLSSVGGWGDQPTAPYTVVVAASMGFHEHFLSWFRRTIWGASTLAALITLIGTWLAVHKAHAPLRDISQRMQNVSSAQLNVRLVPHQVPIELADLAQSFNTMIERIEQDFRKLSNFSADIAHELRTPVTNLITQTQVLLTKARSMDDYREALYSNLEEYERMAKMIGDMLYLAQTDNQLIKPELRPVDVDQEVQTLFDYFEAWAEERQVQLVLEGHTAPIQGDKLMIRRALSNLLSNAITHTPASQRVQVSLSQSDTEARICVRNPCVSMNAEHLPHLFDRFYRVDPSRQRKGDGAGLGLSIVKAIVEAHKGRITASLNDGWIDFNVSLPLNPV